MAREHAWPSDVAAARRLARSIAAEFRDARRDAIAPLRATGARRWIAAVVTGLTLLVVVALPIVEFLVTREDVGDAFADVEPAEAPDVIRLGLLVAWLILVVPVVVVTALLARGPGGFRRALFLGAERPGRAILFGLAFAIGGLILEIAAGLAVGPGEPADSTALDLFASLPWSLLVFLSLTAAVTEELFYRGFLMPRFGLVVSSILFGLGHVNYGDVGQVVVPLVLGGWFGALVLAQRSLLGAIVAHFTWDMLSLALLKLAS